MVHMHDKANGFVEVLKKHVQHFHQIVKFNPDNEKIVAFDFTANNIELKNINTADIRQFIKYISDKLKSHKAKFGIGGYNELRALYNSSELFDKNIITSGSTGLESEPRRLHIGTDIWGEEGTEIFSPLDGRVHSFAFNDHFGDYGATIILQHYAEASSFFTLYGHLSLHDIASLNEGANIKQGQLLAHFGDSTENGNWPPHLHFQIIKNIFPYKGDYPGVCKLSEGKKYLENCPNPDLILNMSRLIS